MVWLGVSDSIEANIIKAEDNVKGANTQLQSASVYQVRYKPFPG